MSLDQKSTSFLNGATIPADPNYEPLPVQLPDELMQEAPPPPDWGSWPDWNNALSLLPPERRRRTWNCRRSALHLRKQTPQGAVEMVNAIACGDRVACPRCATRYAHERAWSAASKLATVSHTAGAAGARVPLPIHVLEFSCVVPEWNACIRAKGCPRSEVIGRLCVATAACPECKAAGKQHARAADIEAQLARWAQNKWLALRPNTGGVRHTAVKQETPGEPIKLVITLFVPACAVETFTGPKTANAEGRRLFFTPIERTDLHDLWVGWTAYLSEQWLGTGTLEHNAPVAWDDIWLAFRRAYAAEMIGWARMIRQHSHVTPEVAHTFARASGLGAHSASGKARRVQRSTWFGMFTGPRKLEALRVLSINVITYQPDAKAEVVDVVKLLHVGEAEVTAQSYRTGEVRFFPRRIVRLDRCVNAQGKPEGEMDDVVWEHEAVLGLERSNRAGKIMRKAYIAGQIPNTYRKSERKAGR